MTKQPNMKEIENIIIKDYDNIAGIVVLKDGETQYEHYFNACTADSRIHVYSVTKSIISILIGIAVDKGYIADIDQKVLDFFPDYIPKQREKTIQNITLRNLLTMTAPFKYKSAPYIKYFTSDDMAAFTLDLLGGRGEIGQFRYTPLIGPDILTGILKKAAGQSVFDFASDNLFKPLGITVKNNVVFHSKEEQLAFNKATDISGWVCDPAGTNTGGWGLTLSPADMAKLGQLYLNSGLWDKKRIVSAEWINESTKEHSRWEKMNLSYGYLWWIHEDGFAAMGDGGNVIYVNTKKNLVAAIASLFKPRVKDRIEFIKKYIEPRFEE
ncbi:serine hydrolase domain-containing protein [Anaerostipes sp.]|uniref:serine hydrolase domain-containing protein n=1 Tax=Anaerostipes sp. TaxID=1872530 RepID=UPI0025C24534|nr:serine hydrolase [Anaerostipes sp.]MBS7008120.1 serine hydrolase [Anaerostipes sp.]